MARVIYRVFENGKQWCDPDPMILCTPLVALRLLVCLWSALTLLFFFWPSLQYQFVATSGPKFSVLWTRALHLCRPSPLLSLFNARPTRAECKTMAQPRLTFSYSPLPSASLFPVPDSCIPLTPLPRLQFALQKFLYPPLGIQPASTFCPQPAAPSRADPLKQSLRFGPPV